MGSFVGESGRRSKTLALFESFIGLFSAKGMGRNQSINSKFHFSKKTLSW